MGGWVEKIVARSGVDAASHADAQGCPRQPMLIKWGGGGFLDWRESLVTQLNRQRNFRLACILQLV